MRIVDIGFNVDSTEPESVKICLPVCSKFKHSILVWQQHTMLLGKGVSLVIVFQLVVSLQFAANYEWFTGLVQAGHQFIERDLLFT